jgi:omega-amidase
MFPTGYTMNAVSVAETMEGNVVSWMKKIASEKKCVISGSVVIKEENKFYNRLLWVTPDEISYYDKKHLFTFAKEERTYSAGEKFLLKEIKGWKIFPLICYDLRFPVWCRRTDENNYDLLLFVASWPERRDYAWSRLLPARAIENQSYVAGVNRVGDDGNAIYHSGKSVILDFKGDILASGNPGEEFVATCSLNMDDLLLFRRQFAFYNDRDRFRLI